MSHEKAQKESLRFRAPVLPVHNNSELGFEIMMVFLVYSPPTPTPEEDPPSKSKPRGMSRELHFVLLEQGKRFHGDRPTHVPCRSQKFTAPGHHHFSNAPLWSHSFLSTPCIKFPLCQPGPASGLPPLSAFILQDLVARASVQFFLLKSMFSLDNHFKSSRGIKVII